MLLGNQRPAKARFTLPEILVAATLVAVFFLSIFEVNGLCLSLISASKENAGATEAVHNRLEHLRNADFSTPTKMGDCFFHYDKALADWFRQTITESLAMLKTSGR